MRLLISALVVCVFVSAAPAALILTVDGSSVDNPYVLGLDPVSLELNLFLQGGTGIRSYDIGFVVQEGPVAFDSSAVAVQSISGTVNPIVVTDTASQYRTRETCLAFEPEFTGPSILIDGLMCDYAGGSPAIVEVVVQNSATSTIVDGDILDGGTVLGRIEFVPEPLTLAMLGVGGLVAVRRRR